MGITALKYDMDKCDMRAEVEMSCKRNEMQMTGTADPEAFQKLLLVARRPEMSTHGPPISCLALPCLNRSRLYDLPLATSSQHAATNCIGRFWRLRKKYWPVLAVAEDLKLSSLIGQADERL
jgi:hypothetical protein